MPRLVFARQVSPGTRWSRSLSVSAFDRYVAAWNAGDLEAWLAVHAPDVEYVSLATGDARVFRRQDGLREVWMEAERTGTAFSSRCSMTRGR